MINTLNLVGLLFAVATVLSIVWSIKFPKKRLWPPKKYNFWTPIIVWVPTFSIFGALIGLGVLGWNEIGWPSMVRYGVGLPLILIANLVVWFEAAKFGVAQTGGAKGRLRTAGFYRFSRNPQYVADIAMITGWFVLSASPHTGVLSAIGIAALFLAPFAEEPWMSETYGQEYDEYKRQVSRYI